MPQLSSAEKTFILIVALTTVVGTALLRLADQYPEYFHGMRRVEAARPARAASADPLEHSLGRGNAGPLAEQINRVAGARTGGAAGEDGSRERIEPPSLPLELNRATAEDLVALPGIGPVLAQRIVDSRRRGGTFESLEDLTRVKGIGPRTIERLRGKLVVSSN